MKKLLVGNAPCSWGTLEFEEASCSSEQIQFQRMLDELVETGYTGTELGDWGYMPTDPAELHAELSKRSLVMLGAFVPIALKYPDALTPGLDVALKTARLLAAVAETPAPFLVLADANGTDPARTCLAGRVTDNDGLTLAQWKVFTQGAERVAQAVRDETGLKTVFHHHCAGYVETPVEIATFLNHTDPSLVGLVFDTGHFTYGSAGRDVDMIGFLDRFADRIWYAHCKDCQPDVARSARTEGWDYFTALRHGVFCELGKGCVGFPAFLRWLGARNYDRYLLVEQDILPGMGSPRESARRNREYLRSIESNFSSHTS